MGEFIVKEEHAACSSLTSTLDPRKEMKKIQALSYLYQRDTSTDPSRSYQAELPKSWLLSNNDKNIGDRVWRK